MECGLHARGRMFFLSLITKLCAQASVVAAEEEERCKVKPIIDLSLIKRLKDNMTHKKSHTSTTKSAPFSSKATFSPSRRLRVEDIFPLEDNDCDETREVPLALEKPPS